MCATHAYAPRTRRCRPATAPKMRRGIEGVRAGAFLQFVREHVQQDLGVGIRVDVPPVDAEHLALELLRVRQVAVVAQGDAERRVDVERLRFLDVGSRIPPSGNGRGRCRCCRAGCACSVVRKISRTMPLPFHIANDCPAPSRCPLRPDHGAAAVAASRRATGSPVPSQPLRRCRTWFSPLSPAPALAGDRAIPAATAEAMLRRPAARATTRTASTNGFGHVRAARRAGRRPRAPARHARNRRRRRAGDRALDSPTAAINALSSAPNSAARISTPARISSAPSTVRKVVGSIGSMAPTCSAKKCEDSVGQPASDTISRVTHAATRRAPRYEETTRRR